MSAEFPYAVFLSHNEADKPRGRMKQVGLRLWFEG